MKRAFLILGLFFTGAAWGILPLPYPTEPMAEELQPGELALKDPRSFKGYNELFSRGQLRDMELPTFETQKAALGYVPKSTFTVPAPLRTRVAFWKKVYAEYTSDQSILHDSEHPHIIYKVVDISSFNQNRSLNSRKRRRLLQRYLNEEKDKVRKNLLRLQELSRNPLTIPLELFPIFRQFEVQKDPNKFTLAAKRIRAQTGQRDRIVRGFLLGGRYFSHLMVEFEKEGIPIELTRLCLVESAFNLDARSKVGASGVWQFMRSTGKRFMRIDKAVDERNDPIIAGRSAARLLRINHESLSTWPLAITAYNHGREGMARAVSTLATRDIAAIINHYESETFGFASANFYASFLAMLEVERDYRTHFGNLKVDAPLQFEEFPLADDVPFKDLAGACRSSEVELRVLNPGLTDWAFSEEGFIPKDYILRVPPGRLQHCTSGYRNVSRLAPRRSITNWEENEWK